MKVKDFFSNDFETSDNHFDELLRTKYYRVDNKKATFELKEIMHQMGFELLEELEEYHELHYYKPNVEVIASIFPDSFFKQGFDFKVNTTYFFPRGRGRKVIEKIYQELDKKFERTK